MLYNIIKPFLFSLDPENAHHLTLKTLQILQALKFFQGKKAENSSQSRKVFGLHFPNPVGLAAGLDKNADCLLAWQALGFGFIEVGTVTPKPQAGNPRPRLFRLTHNEAIINRMGFNSKGIDYLVEKLKEFQLNCPLGINIGKNKDTPLESALDDYLFCLQQVYPYADYVTINLSSPNTPGLTTLQESDVLRALLAPLKEEQTRLTQTYQKKVPLLVKISPDLEKDKLLTSIDVLVSLGIEGVIATNTTLARGPDLQKNLANEVGGLSGAPLFEAATSTLDLIYQHVGESLPIVAVGGIMSKEQADIKFARGAKLVQLYTGLIYKGPKLIKDIVHAKGNNPD